MAFILYAFLAFLVVLVHGHPSNLPREEMGENLFLSSNANILTDGALVSSLTPGDSGLREAFSTSFGMEGFIIEKNSFDSECSSADNTIFTLDPSLVDTNAEHAPGLFTDSDPGSNPFIDIFDPLVATTSLDLNANLANTNCEDSATNPGEFLAEYDPTQDFSVEMFDPSFSSAKAKKRVDRYYDLDPDTPQYAESERAYAADGTAIQPATCPDGKRRACCLWNADPPFSQCWPFPGNYMVCRFVKNKVCCAKVPVAGEAGIDCEKMRWIKARDGRKSREDSPENPPENPASNEFQEIFPILKPLPDLNPDDAYCKPRARL